MHDPSECFGLDGSCEASLSLSLDQFCLTFFSKSELGLCQSTDLDALSDTTMTPLKTFLLFSWTSLFHPRRRKEQPSWATIQIQCRFYAFEANH